MSGALGRVFPPLPPDFAVFQQKFQLFSAVFRMFSISPQPPLAAGIFCFSRQFSVCFQVFHLIPIIIRRISTMSIIIGIDHGYAHISPGLAEHLTNPDRPAGTVGGRNTMVS